MAINPNNELDALHVAYTAASGGGKGVALQYSGLMPKSPCLALFDAYGDYVYKTGSKKQRGFGGKRVYHYGTRQAFARAFKNAWDSKKPFRIAYKPVKPSRDEMLWFCQLMWFAADGNRRLDMVIEELAKWCDSAGKEQSPLGECMTGGRKFGLVVHTVFQRSSEIPKTVLSQSPYKVVGIQEVKIDRKRMAEECDLPEQQIKELENCTYWVKKPVKIAKECEFLDLRPVVEKLKKAA